MNPDGGSVARNRRTDRVVGAHGDGRTTLRRQLLDMINALPGDRVIHPTAVSGPARPAAVFHQAPQRAAVRIDHPNSKVPTLIATGGNECDLSAVGRPYGNAHGCARVLLIGDLARLRAVLLHDPKIPMPAAVGEISQLPILRSGGGRLNLSGLPR